MLTEEVDFRDEIQTKAFVDAFFSQFKDRYDHVLVVTEMAVTLAERLKVLGYAIDPKLTYCAALLHDIGYLPELIDTGFHPIDGARFLCGRGFADLAAFIVCHSNSPEQAAVLGLEEILISQDMIASVITYCDVQVLQGGRIVSYQERLQNIFDRYGLDHPVWKAHQLAEPRIIALMQDIDKKLQGPPVACSTDMV